jgi:hypothetical protein
MCRKPTSYIYGRIAKVSVKIKLKPCIVPAVLSMPMPSYVKHVFNLLIANTEVKINVLVSTTHTSVAQCTLYST